MSKSAHELTRKEMKAPDRFQAAASEAAGWMVKRQKQLALAVGAVVVLAVVGLGIAEYAGSRGTKAGAALGQIIEAAGGEVSAIPLPNFDRPVYKTKDEKEKAVLDAAAQVRDRFGGTRQAATAALLEGDARLALGQWDLAAAAYQTFLAAAPADDSLRFAALDGLARAQEGKGDRAAAAKTYAQAAEIPFFKDRASLEQARILTQAGDKDGARKALEAVGKDSLLQAEAQARLARLGT